METFPEWERRQERRFNRKGVAMDIHREQCHIFKQIHSQMKLG